MRAVDVLNITKKFPVYEGLPQNEQIKDGDFYALSDISLSIENGECTVIAGANGSGKSVLMSIIAGLENPTVGTVKTNAKVGLVFQEPDSQILGETPREDIAFGPRNMKLSKNEIKARVYSALLLTGLEQRADFPARSLSGGEKRRLAAAGVLAMDAQIIIFDEPYANMDYPGVVQINRLFQKLIADGKTIIILTHELEKCLALSNRFIVLCKGKKVYDGSASSALSCNLEAWGIHHPLRNAARELGDLLWL
ncbi:MAG: energy-coupling factor ABC transporter ATP-binding protein [Treponema sp.]|jgi:biotin transport system ATP-binding protein|nr:energy-coupling factor ABC transporter ATP-binding protein [Treponema sp.]